jgi:nucleotide-binding universal stress UspA family protein
MTMIVGCAPEKGDKAALHLGAMLARSSGDDLVVCTVLPTPWVPSMARIDAEYQQQLSADADRALDQARAEVPGDVSASFVRHRARSAAVGLLEQADEHRASLIVLGSSSAGALGHVVLGSVTDQLLHSSPVSLALAPRGYRCRSDTEVDRVTVAYGGGGAGSIVMAAAAIASALNASMRIASLAVWSRPAYTTTLGTDPEDLVLEEWRSSLRAAVATSLTKVAGLAAAPTDVETVVGHGRTWEDALEDIVWNDHDVLLVGSSELGPVAKVFIGSRASKIVRHSPVPVIVLPRGRAEELAGEATAP